MPDTAVHMHDLSEYILISGN